MLQKQWFNTYLYNECSPFKRYNFPVILSWKLCLKFIPLIILLSYLLYSLFIACLWANLCYLTPKSTAHQLGFITSQKHSAALEHTFFLDLVRKPGKAVQWWGTMPGKQMPASLWFYHCILSFLPPPPQTGMVQNSYVDFLLFLSSR